MSEKKKYYVRWIEEHEIEVEATDEESALREAKRQSSSENCSSTGESTAIAA